MARGWQGLTVLVAGTLTLACGDSPQGPEDDVNPALLDATNDAGLASGIPGDLPQGSASFTGPGGMAMDAAGEEFVQEVTLPDGTVLKTSGVYVKAVPDELVLDPPFGRMSFGSAFTGSLESVSPGTYVMGEWPEIDFIEPIRVAYATVRETLGPDVERADQGEITIESLNYFDDVYECELNAPETLVVDLCEEQLGLLQGEVEFSVPLGDGSRVVQQRTSFAVPIRRRTIVARLTGP